MTDEGSSRRVPFDRLSVAQVAILRREMDDRLVAKAEDLWGSDPEGAAGEIEELAALGRMLSGLRSGRLEPDPVARRLVARTVGETRELDRLREEYDRELHAHEAWVALLGHLDPPPDHVAGGPGADEDGGDDPGSPADGPGRGPATDWVELGDRLSDKQLQIVRRKVTGTLAARAGDLHLLEDRPEREREIAEVAALARLAFGLERGEVEVPDPLARWMAERLAQGSKDMNEWEELRERYEAGIAEQDALEAFARLFAEKPAGLGERGGD